MNSKFSLILKTLILGSYFSKSNTCSQIQGLANNSKIENSQNKDHTKISESAVIKIVFSFLLTDAEGLIS